jgi:SAM-dependent methyltransferase
VSAIRDTLKFPPLYLLSQAALGAMRARQRCLQDYAKVRPGMRVLDIGCGPGYLIEYLPTVSYYGFDISAKYINYATRKYGDRGKFYCQRFDALIAKTLEPFDLILMTGLLHHLEDREAIDLLGLSKQVLGTTGHLVTLDPCYNRGQSRMARFLLKKDRGQSIRDVSGYVGLASRIYSQVDSQVREDLFFVPYTALVMVCSQ